MKPKPKMYSDNCNMTDWLEAASQSPCLLQVGLRD